MGPGISLYTICNKSIIWIVTIWVVTERRVGVYQEFIHVFAIEFVTFAIDFILFAIELVTFAIGFIVCNIFVLEFVLEFISSKVGSCSEHQNNMYQLIHDLVEVQLL